MTKKKSSNWSESEIKLLKSNLSNFEIANKTGRSIKAVVSQRHKLNLIKKSNKYLDFAESTDFVIIDDEVPYVMNDNSKSMQYFKALSLLKVGQSFEYPSEEHSLLRNQIILFEYKEFATKKWSETTRRVWLLDERKINEFKEEIKIEKQTKQKKKWSERDFDELKKLLTRYSVKEISEIMGFSILTIYSKIKELDK